VRKRLAVVACVAALCCSACASVNGSAYVWLEGERPDYGNYECSKHGWGNQQYLSEGAWLSLSIPAEVVEAAVPPDGILIAYRFETLRPGPYEVWNRIGYEFVRSGFSWAIDDRPWQEVTPDMLTTDLMDVARWCEVAWLKMGQVELAAGPHVLAIRHALRRDEETGAAQRILYASDALCLFAGAFRPNGRHRPDAAWQDDADLAAAEHVFSIPAQPTETERIVTPLLGTWQMARADEQVVEDRLGPIPQLPDAQDLFWRAVTVPGDRGAVRPEWTFCHRYFYRTRLDVPRELSGRSFVLRFPSTNMIATVFVNGLMCGWNKTPMTAWECDVTAAVRPGEVNELWVGLKDTYYAVAGDTRRAFNVPRDMLGNQGVSHRLDMPVWNAHANGILDVPELVVAGPAYVSDVFAVPSVAKGKLGLEVTVRNPAAQPVEVRIQSEVVPLFGGPGAADRAVLTFGPVTATVPAGGRETVTTVQAWGAPVLWWPDEPRQYEVVTRVTVAGRPADSVRTKFGFREWGWDGAMFTLNGVPWQMRADTSSPRGTPEKQVAEWKRRGQTMMRLWRHGYGDNDTRRYLDAMDQLGMPVRRSGILDGQMAGYGLVEDTEEDGRRTRRAKEALFDNWAQQVEAWVRAERNHPSIFVWSLENEVVYINSINFGTVDLVAPEVSRVARAVMDLDPTRPVMIDGGRALPDNSLPINGCHYNDPAWRELPDAAYTMDYLRDGKFHEPWPLRPDAPVFLGEAFFAAGSKPAAFSQVMGEEAFLGREAARPGVGLVARMCSEGYRWQGLAAFHYWFGDGTSDGAHYTAWRPVCVLCREWDWTFAAGAEVTRTLKILNGTRHPDPVTARWDLRLNGQSVASGVGDALVEPGGAKQVGISFRVPQVTDGSKGEFILTCEHRGKEVFRDAKPVHVIDPDGAPAPTFAEGELAVWDPYGSAAARLLRHGVAFAEISGPEEIPASAQVLVVGRDALEAGDASDRRWRDLAAAGLRILVLEQRSPLDRSALSADLEPTERTGRIAFPEDMTHAVFGGLSASDFFTWSGDHIVYRNAYAKASSGAKSLVQCDQDLGYSALSECPAGDGLVMVCQMPIGRKLASSPTAQRLFDNMVNYCAAYAPVRRRTVAVGPAGEGVDRLLTDVRVLHDRVDDLLSALSSGEHEIVLAQAEPEALRALADAPGVVADFTGRGGWLMLVGLTPDGLAQFNRVVGVDHLIRPFEMERVTFAPRRDPLTAGLTVRDIVMESGRRIYDWAGDQFMSGDAFTYIVDYDDIAPFCQFPPPAYWNDPDAEPGGDRWPRNMVNGFSSADSWRYVFSIHLADDDPASWTLALPRKETVTGLSIIPNAIYHRVTKLRLVFDGDETTEVELDLQPTGERQDFEFEGRPAERIYLELAEWDGSGSQDVVGVDNLWIHVERTDEFRDRVVPLLNIGGLVKYPVGPGGVLLNQLRTFGDESVPVNTEKKRTITAALLRNLGAVFGPGGEVAPEAPEQPAQPPAEQEAARVLRYDQIDLGNLCNSLLAGGENAWFRSPDGRDMAHFPRGENRFLGVPFTVRDFTTSPLPSCIILGGRTAAGDLDRQVTGIPVGQHADALFFLHTCNRYADANPQEDPFPAAFRYTIHYEDDGTAVLPVRLGLEVDHWVQTSPRELRRAMLAWTSPFPGDESGEKATVYWTRWDNPKPDVPVVSIDLSYGRYGDRFAMPALLAVTVGRARV
jgi:hypothetical protein